MGQHDLRAHVPTCKRAKSVPISHFYVPTCQSANKRANVPKSYQLFNLACQHAKGVLIFQFGVSTFLTMLNTCKFLEYLGNCRNLSRETKNLNFGICKIPYEPEHLLSFSMEHVGLTEQLFG